MNALISIRQFRIMIDDITINEIVRAIVDFELVFCKNHNLLMYFKFAMTVLDKHVTIEKIDDIDSFDFDFDFDDDLFDVENSISLFQ